MRRQGLRTRLERLERRVVRRSFPRVVSGLYGNVDADVIGAEANGVTVLRQPGEPVSDLHCRAFAMTGALCLVSLTVVARAAPEQDDTPSCHLTTAPAPEGTTSAVNGVPGIGRIASRAELEKMGAIAVPPARFI